MTDIRLAPLTVELALDLGPLRNTPEVQVHLRNQGIVSHYHQYDWWRRLEISQDTTRMFAVEHDIGGERDDATGKPYGWQLIGCAGLTTIDWQNRRAELSLYTVPSEHELAAGRLILAHAFNDLGLHRVEAETITTKRYKLCTRLGFNVEGVRADAYWRHGTFVDSTCWGLIAEDWEAP